jgi:hypothetical protein
MRKWWTVMGFAVLCSIMAPITEGRQAMEVAGAEQGVCDSLAVRQLACAAVRVPLKHPSGVLSWNAGSGECDDGDAGCHPSM